MIKTQVLVMPGVLDTSLGITLDVMAAANRLQALRGGSAVFDATLVGPGGRRVPTGTGLEVGPVLPLPPASSAPGGRVIVPGVNHVTAPEVLAWVKKHPQAELALRPFEPADLRGCRLLFCCASS